MTYAKILKKGVHQTSSTSPSLISYRTLSSYDASQLERVGPEQQKQTYPGQPKEEDKTTALTMEFNNTQARQSNQDDHQTGRQALETNLFDLWRSKQSNKHSKQNRKSHKSTTSNQTAKVSNASKNNTSDNSSSDSLHPSNVNSQSSSDESSNNSLHDNNWAYMRRTMTKQTNTVQKATQQQEQLLTELTQMRQGLERQMQEMQTFAMSKQAQLTKDKDEMRLNAQDSDHMHLSACVQQLTQQVHQLTQHVQQQQVDLSHAKEDLAKEQQKNAANTGKIGDLHNKLIQKKNQKHSASSASHKAFKHSASQTDRESSTSQTDQDSDGATFVMTTDTESLGTPPNSDNETDAKLNLPYTMSMRK